MRKLIIVVALLAAGNVNAQPKVVTAPGSTTTITDPNRGSAAANNVATRNNTHPDTSPGLQITAVPIGQPENCSAEASFSTGQLRFGALFNFPLKQNGCERRRDSWIMYTQGDVLAAKERMCDEKANRNAYARAGNPCADRSNDH